MTTTTYDTDRKHAAGNLSHQAIARTDRAHARAALPARDRVIVGFLVFFVLMAFTIELYFVLYHDQLVARAATDFFARCFAIYAAGDAAYFSRVTPFTRGLETINVFFTQILNVALIYAIVKQRPWRHGLQLLVGSYLSYSVVLYFWVAHLSGYENMAHKTPWAYFIFFAPNLPWLLAHLYMVYDSMRAIRRRFAEGQ